MVRTADTHVKGSAEYEASMHEWLIMCVFVITCLVYAVVGKHPIFAGTCLFAHLSSRRACTQSVRMRGWSAIFFV